MPVCSSPVPTLHRNGARPLRRAAATACMLLTVGIVAAGAAPLISQAPVTGALEVQVVDGTGGAVTEVLVSARAVRTDRAIAVPSAEPGRYFVADLTPDRYVVTIEKSGFAPVAEEAEIQPGRTIALSVRLIPAGLSEEVTVEATSPVDETAFKLPITLHETPRSVTVFDSERIRAQNFRSVPDTLLYVPNMSVNSYRTEGYHFYSRGYRMSADDTRVDGFAGVNAGGRYGASLFGIEQVVLLRGPASLLYGSTTAPGGLINLVTKKPKQTPMTRVEVRTGGYVGGGVGLSDRSSAGLDIDSTGPLTQSGRVSYRTLFTTENMNYFTARVLDRNRYVNGSLTVKLDPAGRYILTPIVQWTRFNRPHGGGIVISPSTSLATNDGSSGPISSSDLSPLDVNLSAGGGIDTTLQAGAEMHASPTGRLQFNGAYRYVGYDTDINQFTPQVNTAQLMATHTVPRIQSMSRTERRSHNVDVNAMYALPPHDAWKALLQAGVNARRASTGATTANGPLPSPQSPIDIYTGTALTPLVAIYPPLIWGGWTDNIFWNSYLQSRTALADDRWILTLSVGYGQNHPQNARARKSKLMPNGGLIFNANDRLALYTSYATSYNPNDPDAEDILGRRGIFNPTVGRNYEIGAKHDLPQHGSWTLSVFQNRIDDGLVQSGVTDINANGTRYFTAVGTRRSRGVELTAELQPLPSWRISGALSHLDAIYTGTAPASAAATSAIPRSRAEKSPRWSYSAWASYDRSHGPLAGFRGHAGVVWQGQRLGSNGARTPAAPDPLMLPSFARLDAAASYRFANRLELTLNLENALDSLIFVGGTVGSNLEIASPRALTARVGYEWR